MENKTMKTKTKRFFLAAVILIIAVTTMSFTMQFKITVKGSDTMVILAQKWAELYMKKHPDVTIQVTGGGSGVGIASLINGSTDIANSSRSIKKSEIEKIKARYNTFGIEIPCAKDGIAIYLHATNPVNELTLKQLGGIFSGKITNWKEVGGPDATIILYGRENSSGTYAFFKDNVVKADYAANCQTLPGTAAIVNAVRKDKFSIGYGGAAYAEGVKECKVKKDDKSIAYFPTKENIAKNVYPISRYLYMYLKSKPTGKMKEYIDWILSEDGQKIVTQVGYFPVK